MLWCAWSSTCFGVRWWQVAAGRHQRSVAAQWLIRLLRTKATRPYGSCTEPTKEFLKRYSALGGLPGRGSPTSDRRNPGKSASYPPVRPGWFLPKRFGVL